MEAADNIPGRCRCSDFVCMEFALGESGWETNLNLRPPGNRGATKSDHLLAEGKGEVCA